MFIIISLIFFLNNLVSPEINLNVIGKQTENNVISIECNIQCRPNLIKIQWFNGTSLLNKTDSNKLSFKLTRYMNKNQITCQAQNQVGIKNQSIILDINCIFFHVFIVIFLSFILYLDKPIFVDKYGNQLNNSSIILVNEGESIEFSCLVDSSPLSTINWIFNNEVILINKTSIKIDSVESFQHIGIYICSAHHSIFGIFNRTIRLALKGFT